MHPEKFSTEVVEEFYAWYIGTIKAKVIDAEMFGYIEQFSDVDNIKAQIDAVFAEISSNVSNNTSTSKKKKNNSNVRFSLKKPVEKTKELVAVHNLTEEKLNKALELGGFPMPSVAVTKANMGHDKFGDFSFVFYRDTIDPASGKDNKLYGGDAYTPTFPSVTYNSDKAKADKLSDLYYELYKKFGAEEARPLYNFADRDNLNDYLNRNGGEAGTIERLKDDTKMMQLFFRASGDSKVEPVMTRTEKNMGEADVEASQYLIDVLGEDFVKGINPPAGTSPFGYRRAYVEKHLDKIVPALRKMYSELYGFTEEGIDNVIDNSRVADYFKFIRNANDYLNNGGVTVVEEEDRTATDKAIRDKAEKLGYDKWVEETFSGIEGKKGIRNEKDTFTPSGKRRGFDELHYDYTLDNIVKAMKEKNDKGISLFGGSIVGASAKNYKSVEQMKADSDRLQKISQDEYDRIQKEYRDRFRELAMELADGKDSIDAGNLMAEAVAKYNTPSAIKNYIKKESSGFYKYSDEIGNELLDIVNGLANMPTGYFEAKPKRAVGFDEVATAIIPNDTSAELKAKLKENNVPYIEYEKGDEQARLNALNLLEDVKFSLKKNGNTSFEDTRKLLDTIESLKHEFEVTEFAKADPKKLAKVTKDILKEYNSGADFESAFSEIDDLYTYMANGEDGHPAVWEDAYEKATNVASRIVEYALVRDDFEYNEYKELRDYLRKTPIKIDTKHDDVPRGYENFLEFRRANMGRLNLSKKGRSVDGVYKELAELYPGFFSEEKEITSQAMLEQIVNVLDDLKPKWYNPFESYAREATAYLANDIIDRFFDIPQAKPTFADKAERRVVEAKISGRKKLEKVREQRDAEIDKTKLAERMYYGRQMNEMRNEHKAKLTEERKKASAKVDEVRSELREDYNARVDKAKLAERMYYGRQMNEMRNKLKANLAEQRMKAQERIEELRAKKNDQIEKEKAKRRDALAKMSENQKAKVLRARIMRHAGALSQKLLRPSDQKHIPQELQGAVAVLLENINLESSFAYVYGTDGEYHRVKAGTEKGAEPTKRTQAFMALRDLYEKKEANVTVDPDLIGADGLLSDVIKLGDKRIADMTSAELDVVWKTMRAIEATISTANKMFSMSKYIEISEIAEALKAGNAGKNVKTEFRGILGSGQKLAGLDMLTPETYFHYLGEAGDDIFRMMRDSQDKHISIMKEVQDFTHKDLKDVNVNKLEATLHDVTLGGENVKLTTAQLMELYVLMNREQAVEHILVGGILPDEINKGVRKIKRAEPLRSVTQEEIGEALSKLSEEEKAVASKLQKFVSTVLSKYGNEASMKVYNYEKFLEENYWTIRTNKQEVASDVGKDTAVVSVANKGMAKGTVPHANTSVRLGSIFETFASHSSDMATYAAWLGTTEDINRIRNFVFWDNGARKGTVKGILETVHGTQGSAYLEKLLSDISIGVKGTDNMNPLDKFTGAYKAASVGANIRVIIQQPTAILRATDMIAPQYLAVPSRPLDGWKKAKKYAPIAQWKDWGYFDINTGRQMKDVLFDNASLLEKSKQAGMWGASMADSVSWGHLWNAVEAETKAKRKDLEVRSEEYYKAVAKRFTEIVDHTQVVDGILQRSQIMRSADSLTKMATSFMGEPTKQYNMAMAALYDAKTQKGKAKLNAVGRLGRTAVSLAVAGVVNACMQSFVDALRDDDKEKDYWEKWLAAFIGDEEDAWFQKFGNVGDSFNPLTYVPFAKDVLSTVQGYDVKRMDIESISKLATSVKNMYKSITGEGKYTIAESSASLVADVARLFGLPVANIKRDVKSIATTFAIESDNYLLQYRMEKAMLDINYSYNRKNFTDILYNAYVNDREAYEFIYNDLLKNGYDAKTIQDGMETRMKKAEDTTKVSELSKRFMSPEAEAKYDKSLKTIQSSKVWKSASAEQRKEAEADLYSFLTSDTDSMEEMRTEARAYGVDETEYTLWQLAIEMADQPKGQKGNGTYDYKEKAEAINSLNLGDKEIAYFFGKGLNKSAKEEIKEVLSEGIDLIDYVNFKAATSDMTADKDANGNSISGSKKKKVVNYLNGAGFSPDEWNYFYYEIMGYKK